MKVLTIPKFKLLSACLVLLVASDVFCQNPQNPSDQRTTRPLNMLVLGDSILWGQGLKPEHKSWHFVKLWLETNTGRPVIERIEAHSGAVIERGSLTDNLTSANREVNLGLPTVNDEIDSALQFYSDGSRIDLILLSGCGNDVGVQNLLNSSKIEEVDDMTRAKCGTPVEKLLRRITAVFPSAQIIVTGYYPFFSGETRNDFVVKAMARRFFKTQRDSVKMSSKEVFERLKVNSKRWYETSNKTLADAVQKVNAEVGGSRRRVEFAQIEFPSDHSFGAPQTRLWGFNRSPFRMMFVILSFGRILLPSNDETRKQRTASCNELYREQPGETTEQKKERKGLRLYCRYAALGHPNRKGALLYADSIISILKSTNGVAAFSAQ
jgi:lysophospholipase L1-like esterase